MSVDPVTKTSDPAMSLHQRIVGEIEGRILSGEWPPGHRIPFELDLAKHYQCSRMTANKALSQLAKSGLIERRKKSGSFVTQPHAQSAVLEIRDIKDEVQSLGLAYRYHLVQRDLRKATAEERERLELKSGALVLSLQCQHFAGKNPFCYEQRLINLGAVPEARDLPFDTIAPGPWLIGQVPWSAAEHRILAVGANSEISAMLAIAEGTACLSIERRTRMNGAFVTQVRLTYPGHAYEMVANFAPSQA